MRSAAHATAEPARSIRVSTDTLPELDADVAAASMSRISSGVTMGSMVASVAISRVAACVRSVRERERGYSATT